MAGIWLPSKGFALLWAIVFAAAPLAACAQAEGGSRLRLTGGVVHSEKLDPVPPGERPGDFYKPATTSPMKGSAVRSGTPPVRSGSTPPVQRATVPPVRPPAKPQPIKPPIPAQTRFQVPAWLSGVWLRMEAREISRTELPSGKSLKAVGTQIARVRDAFGTYRDMNGQVWQVFDRNRAIGQVDRGQALDVHRVNSYELVVNGPKSAVIKVKAVHTMVNKATRKIVSVYQDEELNTYSPMPDGSLATDSSVKVFDMNGKPILLTRTVSTQSRTAPRNWPPPQSGARTFNFPRPQYLNSPAQFSLEQSNASR